MADLFLVTESTKYSSHQFMNLYVYIKIYLPFSELPEMKMERKELEKRLRLGLNESRGGGKESPRVGKSGDVVGKGARESGIYAEGDPEQGRGKATAEEWMPEPAPELGVKKQDNWNKGQNKSKLQTVNHPFRILSSS